MYAVDAFLILYHHSLKEKITSAEEIMQTINAMATELAIQMGVSAWNHVTPNIRSEFSMFQHTHLMVYLCHNASWRKTTGLFTAKSMANTYQKLHLWLKELNVASFTMLLIELFISQPQVKVEMVLIAIRLYQLDKSKSNVVQAALLEQDSCNKFWSFELFLLFILHT